MNTAVSPLHITLPENNAELPLLRRDWRECVLRRRDLGTRHPLICTSNIHAPLGVDLVWEGGRAPYTLRVASSHDEHTVSNLYGTSYRVRNLFTGEKYFWEITDSAGNKASSSFNTAPGVRLIEFPLSAGGPVNFRDLGGRKTLSGKKVKQGIVYRGSQTVCDFFFEENRKYILENLKIKTDLDLRYDTQVVKEVAAGGVSSLGKEVQWLHYTVNAFDSFTPEQCELFRKTLQTFAVKENYPIYVHCRGGADRTGEISFLFNGLAGVSLEELYDDYELSALGPFPCSRNFEYFQKWQETIATYSSKELPIQEQIEKYCLAIGLTPEEISAIRQNILE